MGDHTRPLTAYDSMTHVPLVYRHPTHIRANTRANILVSNYDFFSTILDYLNIENDQASDNHNQKYSRSSPPTSLSPSPGRTYINTLHSQPEPSWDNTVFFEYETTRSIRTNDWKLIIRFPKGPDELYDLKADPNERHSLIDQPQHARQQKELRARLEKFFKTYADPKYDLTQNGKSKAARRVQ
jgi:arylsulfatase A-like enzyme